MIGDVGIFRTSIAVAPLDDHTRHIVIANVMVDTGSEYTWLPADELALLGIVAVRVDRFETADGRVLERPVGFAMVFAGARHAPTVVAFAEPAICACSAPTDSKD